MIFTFSFLLNLLLQEKGRRAVWRSILLGAYRIPKKNSYSCRMAYRFVVNTYLGLKIFGENKIAQKVTLLVPHLVLLAILSAVDLKYFSQSARFDHALPKI